MEERGMCEEYFASTALLTCENRPLNEELISMYAK